MQVYQRKIYQVRAIQWDGKNTSEIAEKMKEFDIRVSVKNDKLLLKQMDGEFVIWTQKVDKSDWIHINDEGNLNVTSAILFTAIYERAK